jgi:predicted dehydrogenase
MPGNKTTITRRRLLATTAQAVGVLAAPHFIPGPVLGKDGAVAAGERVVMGGFGIGPRGEYVLGCLLDEPVVQFVAIADIREIRRQAIKAKADAKHGNRDCKMYRDFREMLARPDIDAVLIATGDRWHTPASVFAAKAGKDIYCEKPCSLTISESRALADTVRRYGRVYQAGTQRRSVANFMFAADLAHSGKLGKLKAVHANTLDPAVDHDWLPAEPEPSKDKVDWDMWLGPCPWRPYNSKYVAGGWRGFFDFHGGGILEWGAHTVDLCQWGAQADHTGPVEFVPQPKGGVARYANGVELVMRDTGWLGLGTCSVRYEGEDGWVETGDSGKVELSAGTRDEQRVFQEAGTSAVSHVRDFLQCVKTRATCAANADVAGRSHIVSHAAYIAWQLGRTLKWDPVKEEFPGDEEANRMRSRAMREPWRIC